MTRGKKSRQSKRLMFVLVVKDRLRLFLLTKLFLSFVCENLYFQRKVYRTLFQVHKKVLVFSALSINCDIYVNFSFGFISFSLSKFGTLCYFLFEQNSIFPMRSLLRLSKCQSVTCAHLKINDAAIHYIQYIGIEWGKRQTNTLYALFSPHERRRTKHTNA